MKERNPSEYMAYKIMEVCQGNNAVVISVPDHLL